MIDYILIKPLDKCVMIIINILTPSRISIESMMRSTILALDDLCYHRPPYCLLFNTNLFTLCVYLEILAIQHLIFLTSEVLPSLFVKNVVGISPPLKNSWYQNASCHLRSFLGPRVNSNKWTVLFGFCPARNHIALELMVGHSFLDYWLLNHHSDIGRATQPIFRAHLSTNV